MEPIEIAFSKPKLRIMCGGCAVLFLLILGIVCFTEISVLLIIGAGFTLLLFGFTVWFTLDKLIRNEPALIIDNLGIIDISTAISIGRIEWGQIKAIGEHRQLRSLVIEVKDPRYFINRERNILKKGLMRLNWKYDTSPIHINDRLLAVSFDDLVKQIRSRHWDGLPFTDFSEHLVDDD